VSVFGAALVAALLLWVSPAAHAERVHVVKPGESLWSIAESVAGDASLWPALFRANRDQIADPSVLHPGQRLAIPALTAADEDDIPPDTDLRIR
jgi:nucleoid-associated protein YgaU